MPSSGEPRRSIISRTSQHPPVTCSRTLHGLLSLSSSCPSSFSPFLPPSSIFFFFLPRLTLPSPSSPSSLPSLINHLPVGRNFFLPGAGGHLVPLSLTCRGTVGSKGVGARVPNMSLSPPGTSFYCICIPIGVALFTVCSSRGLL